MKILYLSSSLSRKGGGIFEVEKCMSRELASRGEVSIEVAGLRDAFSEVDRDAWGAVPTNVFPLLGPKSFGYSPKLARWLAKSDYDAIHLHGLWMYPSIATRAWSEQHLRPFIVTPHGMLEPWALKNAAWKKRIAMGFYENRMLQQATCLHAFTEREAMDFRRLGLSKPIAIIPNGVLLPQVFRVNEQIGPFTMLFLGRIHRKKGLENLLRGWASVRMAMQNWRLVIAGWDDGGFESVVRKLIRDLGLTSQVDIVGPSFGKKKQTLFQNSTAFILPSFSEGLPMAILEAWSYAIPVLMTDNCNLSIGFAADAAIRIESTPDSIARGLLRMASASTEQRLAMGSRGRELVGTSFNWQSIADDMMSVYRWILGNGPRPGCVLTD